MAYSSTRQDTHNKLVSFNYFKMHDRMGNKDFLFEEYTIDDLLISMVNSQ